MGPKIQQKKIPAVREREFKVFPLGNIRDREFLLMPASDDVFHPWLSSISIFHLSVNQVIELGLRAKRLNKSLLS